MYTISLEQSKRINTLKMLFCIFVVYTHASGSSVNFSSGKIIFDTPELLQLYKLSVSSIVSCCNDGFFIISSILLYRKPFKWSDNISKKAKSIAIPYLFANALYIAIFALFQNLSFTKSFFGGANPVVSWGFFQWLGAFGIGAQYPYDLPTWFLRNLFILNIFSLVIKRIIDGFPKLMLGILIVSLLFIKSTNCYYVNISNLCFWCFGYYIVKYNINLDTLDDKKLLLPIYLLSIALTTFLKLSNLNEFLFLVISRINIVVSIAFWYSVFSKNLSGIVQRVFEKYSEYYFFVILLHEAILMAAIKIFFRVFEPTPIMQFISFTFIPIAIAVFLILVAILFKKLLPKAYNIFTGQR